MTQSPHTTNPSDDRLARTPAAYRSRYFDLEPAICDISNVVIVLETVAEDAIGCRDNPCEKAIKVALPNLEPYRIFVLTEEQIDALDYVLHHVGDLARALRKKYYREVDEAEGGER